MAGSASTMFRGLALPVLMGLAFAAPARADDPAVPAAREGEHARLDAERAALREELAQQEKACYQRFAVTGCLQQARSAARERDNALLERQRSLQAQERQERARLKQSAPATPADIAEEEPAGTVRAAPGTADAPPPRPPRMRTRPERAERPAKPARAAAAPRVPAVRKDEAEDRQRREAQARQRFMERQERARQRREAHERRRAENEAAGRVPAAPLPPAGAP